LLVGGYETRDTLINILALEFTNYQKRIEKLEKDLKEAHMLLTGCQGTVLFKSVSFAKRVENFISKSHLAKGVKEG
jgi:predicted RNase H-like nuclease (RuvC/YqgF family)